MYVLLSLVTSAAVGEVTIGVGPGFVDQFAIRVLAPFMRAHPDVRVDIVTGGTGEVLSRLQRDEVDLAVALHPAVSRGVRVVNSIPQAVGLACAIDHRLASHPVVQPAQLGQERMAVLPEGFGLRSLHDGFVRAHAAALKTAHATSMKEAGGAAPFDDSMTRLYNYFALPPVQTAFCTAAAAVAEEAARTPTGEFARFAGLSLLVLDAPGRGTLANAAANEAVTLLWPPRVADDFSLIVDGTAEVAGERLRVRPTGAVLHRPVAAGPGG